MALEATEVDVGEVQRGATAHCVFRLRNAGGAPLEIEARPTCGCTVASYDKVVAPGVSGTISADFRTAGYRGRVTKVIQVTSNDPDHPRADLRLVATVRPLVEVLPAEMAVVSLAQGEATVREFELRPTAKNAIEVTRATCSVPYATATLAAADGEGAATRSYKLTVRIGPEAPAGRSTFIVSAATSSPVDPQVLITFLCDKGILVVPQSVFMATTASDTVLPVPEVVTLSKRGGSFRVVTVASEDPRVAVQQEVLRVGSDYRLRVAYRGGRAGGVVRTRIVVQTDDPQQPRLEIPVTVEVAGAPAR